MAEQAVRPMTVDEFLAWDDGTDKRHELIDGTIHAMAPPSNVHGTIVSNAALMIGSALRGKRPCRSQSEAGVRIDQHTWWQADLAATCTPIIPGSEIDRPILIVEVLSPNTRVQDLGRKLIDYKALPSVREIWMVDSERRWLQLWRRTGSDWVGQDL